MPVKSFAKAFTKKIMKNNLFCLFIVLLPKHFQGSWKKNFLEVLNGLLVQVIILAGHSALVGEHLSEGQICVGVIRSTSRHQIVIDMSGLVTHVLIKPSTNLFHIIMLQKAFTLDLNPW